MTRENATDAGRQHPESWVTADKFEHDCRPDRRETGVVISERLERRVAEAKAKRAAKAG